MVERERNTFNAECNAKVALKTIHGVKTLNRIAQEDKAHPAQVSNSKKELQQQAA